MGDRLGAVRWVGPCVLAVLGAREMPGPADIVGQQCLVTLADDDHGALPGQGRRHVVADPASQRLVLLEAGPGILPELRKLLRETDSLQALLDEASHAPF